MTTRVVRSPGHTGKSPVRHLWRYFTPFQFRLWRDVVRAKLASRREKSTASAVNPIGPAEAVERADKVGSSPIPAAGVRPEALDALALQGFRRSWNSLRPDLENQLSKLERFVSLCRDNGVQLT